MPRSAATAALQHVRQGIHGFTLAFSGFDPDDEGLREALTSTGNGFFCTRGAAEWEAPGPAHYAGTYSHGVYNRETTILAGQPVPNEDLVALPNWLLLQIRIEDEEPLSLENVELLSYNHHLNTRHAVVGRDLRVRDQAGRESTVLVRRFVSMARMHQAGLSCTLTAENWSGRVEVISAVDGRITNRGVARYRQLEGRHLDPVAAVAAARDVIALEARTRQSSIEVAEAARTRVFRGDVEEADVARSNYQTRDYAQQVLAFDVAEDEPVRVEKMVALYTSRDRAIDEPLANAGKSVARYPRFDDALAEHERAWEDLWRICDIRYPQDEHVQFLLRFHISHVLQVCSPLTPHHDAGVPARGLNGEAYRGHVFWDELYIYPFLNLRLPEVTRGLLMYRYRRLGEARAAAIDAGYRGAMYPWQSGSDGREETQVVHLNPHSGRWDPDVSHLQRHVGLAIFYNIWQYYQATEDVSFLRDYGAEMMLEIARFWCSIAHYNPSRERWEIHGVMGPDEFHTHMPGAAEPGLRNNAYTNVMVAWMSETAQTVLDMLPTSRRAAIVERIGLSEEEIRSWNDMSRRMFVPFHADGVISQFEGYERLEELDWGAYRRRHENIQRLDRILRAEGDDPNRYKVTKQADTLMLFFLFPEHELTRLLRRLGYSPDSDTARRNINYYGRRTSHGSTLSLVTHAAALAPIDAEESWEHFLVALESDVGDIQGGTTKEGIHMGVMSGTLDLMQRAFMGVEIRDDALWLAPRVPGRLDGLSFPMQFRGTHLTVAVDGAKLIVAADPEGFSRPITVHAGGQKRILDRGDRQTFPLAEPAAVPSAAE